MEIFKNLDNPASKEFEKLLNSQFTKNQNLVEGKVINCIVSKVTDKFVYLTSEGLKQEPIIDLKELQLYGLSDKAVEGATIQCLLEKLEHPKTGEIVVSVEKAIKLEGWNKIVELYKKEEPVNGRIIRKCKGGAEVSLDDLKLSAFLPGSMVDESPLKNFDFFKKKNHWMFFGKFM